MFMSLFTINYAIVGISPWGWHLINLLIHTACTILVFIVLRELARDEKLAAVASAFFAVHPAHAESVAWVSGITDPLMCLFLLPAFYFYLRFRRNGQKYLIAVVLLLYAGALFCKETALSLPLIVAWCELFQFGEGRFRSRIGRTAIWSALFIVPTAGYFVMRYIALSGILFGSGQHYPWSSALRTIPIALAKYLKLMVLPAGHSYQHYTEFVGSMASSEFLLPVALIVVTVAGIVMSRSRLLAFSAVWFIATLAPALAAIRQFDREYLVQDRYLYLPSIGFCLAAALGIRWIFGRFGMKPAAAVTLVLVIIFGAAYMRQNRVWADGFTLFENCVDTDPDSAEAHLSLARTYFDAGRVREGEEHANRALELDPGSVSPYLVLSYFSTASGRREKAIELLERGAASVPETPITRYKLASLLLNLGLLYSQEKNATQAEKNMLSSIETWPRPTGWFYTGQFYFDQSRYEDALAMFHRCLDSAPRRFAAIHLKLGQTYDKLGRVEDARMEYQTYLELAPAAPERAEVVRRLSQL
jgi:tetratricopeptide (TPR) repeat protein